MEHHPYLFLCQSVPDNGIYRLIRTFPFFQVKKSKLSQASKPIPGYFSGNDNCNSTGKNRAQTKWWEALSPSQFAKFTLKSIYELWRKGCGITYFRKQTKWWRESGDFKLANLDMGHLPKISKVFI